MQNVFLDTRILDKNAREKFSLTEDSMMECAAKALLNEVTSSLLGDDLITQQKRVLILCGCGNNGGDGYALARLCANDETVAKISRITVCVCADPKSDMCKVQYDRLKHSVNPVTICTLKDVLSSLDVDKPHVIVDCIFGSGFHGELSNDIAEAIQKINLCPAVKIACDVPSGLDMDGNTAGAFIADVTITMGALKTCLLSNTAKEFVGRITVADLGISRDQFECDAEYLPQSKLLEHADMTLPHRNRQNVNKGDFGHVAVVVGEKIGAGVIAGSSAFRFGAGLVSLVSSAGILQPGAHIVLDEDGQLPCNAIVPYDLMCCNTFPANTTAVAMGMGLGRPKENKEPAEEYFSYLTEHCEIPCVLDADVFYSNKLPVFLQARGAYANVVLTPHPKEFVSLLRLCMPKVYAQYMLDNDGVQKVISHQCALVKEFCSAYQGVVLLLKGAVVTIGVKYVEENNVRLYFNPYGTNALAKGGSGDVLAGMICALLAQSKTQGYTPLTATISASLAHAFASARFGCDYALTPFSLIKETASL
jgi:hydroxyethylthiazole kinase-like uncharacterized protein yjeF